ncbi:MAG: histidine phosphatase family protein [Paracoccus sp. (in: a-proteobacteria)]
MQGHLDSPLTALGRNQAVRQSEIMAPVLADVPAMSCIASPLGRAVQTARIVCGERPFRACRALLGSSPAAMK